MVRYVSTGVASALLAGLLSTFTVVSPQEAGAADDPTPVVPSQSLGSVPAQQAEEVGKTLPTPEWPSAAEASVDLSEAAPGVAGEVSSSPSASASGDTPTQVGGVVEVAPPPAEQAAEPQLGGAQRLDGEDTPSPSASTSVSAEPSPSASAGEASPSASGLPEASASPSDEPTDDVADTISPDQVDVRILDRKEVEPAGGVGLGLQVLRTDGAEEPGQVQVDIDYSGFKYAYGGDFADRLRLVKLPACALQTPEAAECAKREFVEADNDTAKGTLTATVTAEPDTQGATTQLGGAESGAGVSVYALTTGSSSDQGDYRASTLPSTGSWSVSTGSGAFTYNLPIQLPTPPMGEAPQLAMTYNSQSVDGRTSASNNQASWAGMGWDLSVGFIERRYRNCSDDGLKTIGDLCWDSPNSTKEPSGAVYVINLNGVSSELIQDNTGTGSYHVKDDPGWRVQRLTGGYGAGRDGEYWVISSQDGHRYYFGWGRSERTTTATASVFTVPVVGNDAGEPCHDQFPEPCTQAWRWNLDRVVDKDEVESMYFYDKEYNHYRSVANADKARSYVSSGYLKEIQYGWASQITDGKVPAKVELSHVNRCIERMAQNDPLRNAVAECPTFKDKPGSYPDVPIDLMCDGTSADYNCAGKTYYPTFFSTDMLWDIKTYVADTAGTGWDLVEQFQTKHGMPNPDGAIGKTLWFDYLQREVYGNDPDLVLPVINFNGTDLDNKVGSTELNFRRVSEIHGDTGATTTVNYGSANPCDADALPSQSGNGTDCYWQKWTPEGATEAKTGWFRKYLVKKVEVDPTVTTNQDGAPVMTTTYDYVGQAGWRFTADPLTPDDDETWSDWRGYQEVEVTSGAGTNKHSTKTWLYRGLDGDRTSKTDPAATKSVTVNDGYTATKYTDSDWLAGKTISTTSRDDAGKGWAHTLYSYWSHNTAQYDGLPDARFVRESKALNYTLLSDGTWREHGVEQEYDDSEGASTTFGLPMRTDDWGESSVSDNRCTAYGRAYNTDNYDSTGAQRWTVLQDQVKHYSVGCSSIADTNQDGYTTTLYDNSTAVADNHPADGDPTEVRTYTKAGTYNTVNTGYDNAGRTVWKEDGQHNRTTLVYSPANSWPVDGITTTTPDPDGSISARGPLASTQWISRFWGVPYQSRDVNGNLTKITLDAAGRITEVWKPTETGSNPSMKFGYRIPTSTNGSGVPDSVDGYPHITTSLLQSGSTYLTSHEFTDALGRTREKQVALPDDVPPNGTDPVAYRQASVTRYDSSGNVAGTSAVFRNQGVAGATGPSSPLVKDIPSYTDVAVDWAGRTTLSQLQALGVPQEQGKVATTYGGEKTTVKTAVKPAPAGTTEPVGGTTDTYTDVYGQTSKIVEHNGTSLYTTSYGYTGKGELAKITDGRGNNTLYGYDWAGQRTSTDDPDAGVSSTTYDVNGGIDTVTSNAGKNVVSYGYDNLGRKTSIRSGSDELATWSWDGIGITNGKGKIYQSTNKDTLGNIYTTKTSAFDTRGRPTSTTTTIPANVTGLVGSYTTTLGYDAADHVTTVGYPAAGGLAAETVTTAYDVYGHPNRTTSSLNGTVYVDSTAYDAYDRISERLYGQEIGGNGVNAMRTYDYDDANGTRWLNKIATTTSINELVSSQQVDTYKYDLAGKITEVREQAGGQTATSQSQCFTYNDIDMLKKALTTTAASCTGVTASDFKGTAPYQTTYNHDLLGNLQIVTDTNSSGQTTDRDYLYPGYDDNNNWTTANADQPHGVRAVKNLTDGTLTSTDTITYNADGTMLKRTEPGTGASTAKTTDYTWTKQAQLATVTTTKSTGSELTRYAYDADGNLLVRTRPAETVAYLGGTELTTTDGKTATATRYYTSGPTTIAMRTTNSGSGKVTYLTADTQASTQLAIDAGTGATTRRRYTPFGDERSGNLPAGTDHGFLGKSEDKSTGLSLLGARAYDPALGRFLSPDPLSTPYNPQNLSAYSYSNNDPVNNSDPSGLQYQADGTGFEKCTKPGGCVHDVPDGVSNLPEPIWTYESVTGGDVNNDGVVSVYPGVDIPATWAKGDQFIQAFHIVQEEWPNGWTDPVPGSAYSAGQVAAAVNEACLDVGGCPKQMMVEANLMSAAINAELTYGGGTGHSGRAKNGKEKGRGSCNGNSFTESTQVLLANGKHKKIKDIKPGDKVLAADPDTGSKEARQVSATIIGSGTKHLVDLTIATKKNRRSVITATDGHLFWIPEREAWIEAGHLKAGEWLETPSGEQVRIDSLAHRTKRNVVVRNLTVDGLHTYYVMADETPILAHNAGECPEDGLPHGALGEAATLDRLQNEGYTNITREVRFKNSNGDVFRADFVAQDRTGTWVAVEVKTGKGAKLTDNQSLGYSELGASGAELNSSRLPGLKKGSTVIMKVQIDLWSCGVCNM
ncbi:RHS repeat-associated core domain-containing protein [Streptomyces sp. NPDC052225]|uniref:RHS repeat-associated core domain-containing protein n=1 Tax=Streptomyces sp. NPDC052225 TaxID=3154949 RepID=UPI00342395DF